VRGRQERHRGLAGLLLENVDNVVQQLLRILLSAFDEEAA